MVHRNYKLATEILKFKIGTGLEMMDAFLTMNTNIKFAMIQNLDIFLDVFYNLDIFLKCEKYPKTKKKLQHSR